MVPGIISWHIWKYYNQMVWDSKPYSIKGAIKDIKTHIHNWVSSNANNKFIKFDSQLHEEGLMPNIRKSGTIKAVKWSITSDATLCLNVDASFSQTFSAGGAIIRDRGGQILDSFCFPTSSTSAIHAEIEALLKSIEAATSKGLKGFEVQTDCQDIHNAYQGKTTIPGFMNSKILKIKELCNINNLKLTHTVREANRPAHLLAKEGRRSTSFCRYDEHTLPPQVLQACSEDRRGRPFFRDTG
ncbi:unnamed protein product [Cuscuta epithymum]|uniref:RNase H type-1 domain-containing protein n=1 Tax=Cuscuta epithymum TaxID=186058 RepID=A0AAV0ELJ3_9ASTE|nr:unnamed protein product [Cuscuta epithymum]